MLFNSENISFSQTSNNNVSQVGSIVDSALINYRKFIIEGNSSYLESMKVNLLTIINNPNFPIEGIVSLLNHFNEVERDKLQLEQKRKDPKLSDKTRNDITILWLSLLSFEILNFEGYMKTESLERAMLQKNIVIYYQRFIQVLLQIVNSIDSPEIIIGFLKNATRRILTYNTFDSQQSSDIFSRRDSLYWSNFQRILNIEFANASFCSNFWIARQPMANDRIRLNTKSDSIIYYKNKASHSYMALSFSENNLSKYLSCFSLAKNLRDAEEFDDAILYFNEALSLVEEIELNFPSDSDYFEMIKDEDKRRQNAIVLEYHPILLKAQYYNVVDKYNTLLEKSNDYKAMMAAHSLLLKIWHSEHFTQAEKIPAAIKLRRNCIQLINKMQSYATFDRSSLTPIYEVLNEIETFLKSK